MALSIALLAMLGAGIPAPSARLYLADSRTWAVNQPNGQKVTHWVVQPWLRRELEMDGYGRQDAKMVFLSISNCRTWPCVVTGFMNHPNKDVLVSLDGPWSSAPVKNPNAPLPWAAFIGALRGTIQVGWSDDPWRIVAWTSGELRHHQGMAFVMRVRDSYIPKSGESPYMRVKAHINKTYQDCAVRVVVIRRNGILAHVQSDESIGTTGSRDWYIPASTHDVKRFELQIRNYHWLPPISGAGGARPMTIAREGDVARRVGFAISG